MEHDHLRAFSQDTREVQDLSLEEQVSRKMQSYPQGKLKPLLEIIQGSKKLAVTNLH